MKTILFDGDELIDFQLYGLISSYNDTTQFIYHTNRCFETCFLRDLDLDVVIDKHLTYFPIFKWEEPETGSYYSIIKNTGYTNEQKRTGNELFELFDMTPPLIAKYKDYNFLLKVNGDENDEIRISENEFIQRITKLRTEKIKSIERLIF